MIRKSQREIERDIEQLDTSDEKPGGILFGMTTISHEGPPEESPHPELTVEEYPDSSYHDTYCIATPNVWPERYIGPPISLVYACDNTVMEMWGGEYPDHDNWVTACELWDLLTEEELQAEYEYRTDNDEQMPPLLADRFGDSDGD